MGLYCMVMFTRETLHRNSARYVGTGIQIQRAGWRNDLGCRARSRRYRGVSEDILADLRANFEGECSEVGMYLAMARVAHREGYPEIGLYWEKAAYEEAEHAAKFMQSYWVRL